jgi:hypothetical protein
MVVKILSERYCYSIPNPNANRAVSGLSIGLETSDSNLHFLIGNGGHIEIFSYRIVIFNDLA